MDNKQLIKLLNLYMDKNSSERETLELFDYISDPENAQQVTELLGEKLNEQTESNTLPAYKQQLILNHIFEHKPLPVKKSELRSLTWVKMAAAILLFSLPVLYFLNNGRHKANVLVAQNKPSQNDVKPGGDKAILTLSDGSRIVLNSARNGTIAQQGNAQIMKLADGHIAYNKTSANAAAPVYNTMTTPRGGKYDLLLSDGTKVWLNAASSITYPIAFTGTERRVTITGEAYFEVAKNKKMPFKVNVNGQEEVQVLGTHFNIMAYDDEAAVKTTLLEGSVKIVKNNITGMLKPGQQAQLTAAGKLSIVDDADITEVMAWKNGQTLFVNQDIKSIMRQVSRWYDIDVQYQGDVPARLFTGGISRESNLSVLLKILELNHIHFKVTDKNIIVTP
ncbi:FecR family protein [Mucilaginibacter sp. SP1R1]|uniref:FecR family protein n=1 Tax=Mucilaginibacter sp. SP1R1 TaxID=2723091 RepID=UPI001616675F|nr:FecR family protein [Mucilaginibacter sp. SP1R1]MBB6151501.1 ferric-dicitrate binding protein FerR (iron transport regulator) [Mucilaginibacter sp. SP1R1]